MEILSLDQATRTGFAVLQEDGKVLQSGVWDLSSKKRTGESWGMRFVRFRKHLQQILNEFPRIGLIVHEQTLLQYREATEIAMGLKSLILEEAALRGIEVTSVITTELKKFATGNGNAKKPDMESACFWLSGVSPVDDNEADAVLIGLWAASKYGAFPAPEWPAKKKTVKKNG